MTDYTVLEEVPARALPPTPTTDDGEISEVRTGGPAWAEVATWEAHSADHAIRLHAQALAANGQDPAGRYVAVPTRSWKIVQLATQTQTRLVVV